MSYQQILAMYDPEHNMPSNGQPMVTWVEFDLAHDVERLRTELAQLRAELEQLQAARSFHGKE